MRQYGVSIRSESGQDWGTFYAEGESAVDALERALEQGVIPLSPGCFDAVVVNPTTGVGIAFELYKQ